MKGRMTPKRRTVRIVRTASWANWSPIGSLLGGLKHEGHLRSASYRGGSAGVVIGDVPRYARTPRTGARRARHLRHIARLQNISRRSTTAIAHRAGIKLASLTPTTRVQLHEHPDWGTIRLNPYVKPEQRERAARREQRQAEARARRRHPQASLEHDVEQARMLDRIVKAMRPDFLGRGIRTMGRGA